MSRLMILRLPSLAAALASFFLAALASSCTAALPSPRPHPRLEIDTELLREIRILKDQGNPAWTRLERWSKADGGTDLRTGLGQAVYGRMLVFLVNGDGAQFDAA